jgi:hypothetical protein
MPSWALSQQQVVDAAIEVAFLRTPRPALPASLPNPQI